MQTPRFLLPGVIALLVVTTIALGMAMYFQRQRTETRLNDLRQLMLDRRNAPVPTAPSEPQPPSEQVSQIGGRIGAEVTLESDGTIRSNGFTAALPAAWRLESLETGWLNAFDPAGTNVASLRCPVPEAGYQAWDFTQTDRAYVRDGITHYATKWIGAPNEGADGLGWLAIVMGGSPEPGIWGTYGCQVMMQLSAPPTKAELDTVDAIFESVR